MRVIENRDRSRLIAAAMQKIPCDLTIENVKFVNVITGEIYPASVDILDGIVIRVRTEGEMTKKPSNEIYDGKGNYLVPGFIDIHMHIESTMMIPENFGRAAILCGTTSVFVDPHEIGNVMGIPGVRFMVENARKSPVRQFNLAPSCVPSVPGVEGAGAEFNAGEIADLLGMDGVYGIAEVMDFVNVVQDAPRMHDIVEEGLKRDCLIQGHAPGVLGKELAAYILAGPTDNHSLSTAEEACQDLRAGLYANFQESSLSARRMPELLKGIKNHRWHDHVTLCTDDVHAKDLMETGHVNRLIKSVLMEGIDPVEAIRWATYNSGRDSGFRDLGAIAPGYVADIQLLGELDGRNPEAVFVAGKLAAEHGVLVGEYKEDEGSAFQPENTVHIDYITGPDMFRLKAPVENGTVRAAVMDYDYNGTGKTEVVYEEVPVRDGYVDISGKDELHYMSVWNRHKSTDHTITLCRNFGLLKGAMGSTIAHDCHNLVLAYRDREDAHLAARALAECGGGICAVHQGEVKGLLKLPVAGLMSTLPCEKLVPEIGAAEAAVDQLCDRKGKLMKAAILSLACIPMAVITDRGLVDGRTQKFYELFQ
ncbi:adenine deaminase [Anaerolentibacter hominis]|uniref:adenine deaminase n=1 Tax=Anaerolentibacter hominis TaxID=3079009 RepID=UPI0031B881BD